MKFRKIGCLVGLTLAMASAPPLEAGKWPLRKKCLVVGTTLVGAALLGSQQVLEHGAARHPLSELKADNGTAALPAIADPGLATLNRTELPTLVLTLPEFPVALDPAGPAAEEPKAESKEPVPAKAQDEAARVDALVLAAQKAFAESLCPGELQPTVRVRSRHRKQPVPETWSMERVDAILRQNAQELASEDAVRVFRERVGGALDTLNASACMVLRKYRESSQPYKRKRALLKDRILNLRRQQAHLLDDEVTYNRAISDGFSHARLQTKYGHHGWEEAPGSLPYSVREAAADAEWDRMEAFADRLVDAMAPILLEMMPGNSTVQERGQRKWHFRIGW
jgi:hypothetical protein